MGTWGTGAFDNDDAHDWVSWLTEAGDDGPLFEAFDEVLDGSRSDFVDIEIANTAIAAAEAVAALGGEPGPDVPPPLTGWIDLQTAEVRREMTAKHAARAAAAVERVRDDSALADEWARTSEHTAWARLQDDLLRRLGRAARAAG